MRSYSLYAKNNDELEDLKDLFLEHGFKLKTESDDFFFLFKKAYGNGLAHLIFLILALFVSALFIFGNLIIFLYYFYKKSQYVLITTRTTDNGEKIEFDKLENIDLNRGKFS